MAASTAEELTVPSITSDQALRIARLDAERVYRDLSPYRVSVSLESDGWHVDYDLKDPHLQGGGPTTSSILKMVRFWPGSTNNSCAGFP